MDSYEKQWRCYRKTKRDKHKCSFMYEIVHKHYIEGGRMEIQKEMNDLLKQNKIHQEIIEKFEEIYGIADALCETQIGKTPSFDLTNYTLVIGISTPKHEKVISIMAGKQKDVHNIIMRLAIREMQSYGHTEDKGD